MNVLLRNIKYIKMLVKKLKKYSEFYRTFGIANGQKW